MVGLKEDRMPSVMVDVSDGGGETEEAGEEALETFDECEDVVEDFLLLDIKDEGAIVEGKFPDLLLFLIARFRVFPPFSSFLVFAPPDFRTFFRLLSLPLLWHKEAKDDDPELLLLEDSAEHGFGNKGLKAGLIGAKWGCGKFCWLCAEGGGGAAACCLWLDLCELEEALVAFDEVAVLEAATIAMRLI